MEPLTQVSGVVAPLMQANIDTDVIIRIERLTSGDIDALGRYAFEALRYDDQGQERADFVFNQDAYKRAPILAAGPNFGCGSSREGAVTAIAALGVRCILAESFGDIFYANCFQNGLLPIRLNSAQMDKVAAVAAQAGILTIDLEQQRVILPDGEAFAFEIAALRREALLFGLDDIGLSLRRLPTIRDWQASHRRLRPWIWDLPPGLTALESAPFKHPTA